MSIRDLRSGLGRASGEGLRTLIVTAASFATGFLLTVAGTELLGWDAESSYSASVLFCTVCNFFAYRYYIFRSSDSPLHVEALKFFPFFLAFRGLEIVLFSATTKLGLDYRIAYVSTAIISMALKFLVAKFFIFRRRDSR